MSNGISGRKYGDTFVSPQHGILNFKSLKFYPDSGGSYSHDEMNSVIGNLPDNIIWDNKRNSRLKAFALIDFGNIIVGRYLVEVKIPHNQNYISNSFKCGIEYSTPSSTKTRDGVTPQDILSKKIDITSADILNDIKQKLGVSHILYDTAKKIECGLPFPITIPAPIDVSYSAFRDYFCELLHPIALQCGNYSGNGSDAARMFLGTSSFSNTTISFDDSKNAGLSDSKLSLSDGRTVKLSSKGGGGAEASVKNLIQCINDLDGTTQGAIIREKYRDVIEIIHQIQSSGQSNSPLFLGVKFGLIDESDASIITSLKDEPHIDLRSCGAIVGKKLQAIADGRTAKNPSDVSLYYHLLAAIAHRVAHLINTQTDFGAAASSILNNSALVQVYTKSRDRGTSWVLEGFDTVYPLGAVQMVNLSATKNYSSTGIKGNFTFKIIKK